MLKISPKYTNDFDNLPDDVEYFLSHYFGIRLNRPIIPAPERVWRPHTDMFETEKEIMVIVEIAGVPEKEINILLDRDFLIIRGSRRESLTQFQKRQYHKMEIDYGPFERVIKLPSLVETEGIEATMKDGFLMIRLKKTETRNPPKEITIE